MVSSGGVGGEAWVIHPPIEAANGQERFRGPSLAPRTSLAGPGSGTRGRPLRCRLGRAPAARAAARAMLQRRAKPALVGLGAPGVGEHAEPQVPYHRSTAWLAEVRLGARRFVNHWYLLVRYAGFADQKPRDEGRRELGAEPHGLRHVNGKQARTLKPC